MDIAQFKRRLQRLHADVFSDIPQVADAYSATVAVPAAKESFAVELPAATFQNKYLISCSVFWPQNGLPIKGTSDSRSISSSKRRSEIGGS
jgi:hypothetical protein